MRKWILYSYDLFIAALAPLAAFIIRDDLTIDWQNFAQIYPYAALGLPVAAICFLVAGTYKGVWRFATLPDFTRIIAAVTASILLTVTIYFIFARAEGVPRSVPLIQWSIMLMLMIGARLLTRTFLRHPRNPRSEKNIIKEHTLVIGLNHVAELYLRCVAGFGKGRIAVEGILDENSATKGRLLHHHKVIGQPAELARLLDDMRVHGVEITRIVVATAFKELSPKSRNALLEWETSGKVTLDLFEERLGFGLQSDSPVQTERVDETVQAAATEYDDKEYRLIDHPYNTTKRLIDIVGSLTLIVALSPFITLAVLLVAIDVKFPILFWQQRPGRFGVPFRLYKFRTMGAAHDCSGNHIPDEKRQSAIGYFLRRSRLDELPQLFNILIGDMSFVGPRPLLPIDHPENGNIRHAVRPGVTGWAQVNGGKLVTPEEKLALDIWYIKRIGFKEDLRIAIKTLRVAIAGDNLEKKAIQAAMIDIIEARKELEGLQYQANRRRAPPQAGGERICGGLGATQK